MTTATNKTTADETLGLCEECGPDYTCAHRYRPEEQVHEYVAQLFSYVLAAITRRARYTLGDIDDEVHLAYSRAAIAAVYDRYDELVPWEIPDADEAALIEQLAPPLIALIKRRQKAAYDRSLREWKARMNAPEMRAACACGHPCRNHALDGEAECTSCWSCGRFTPAPEFAPAPAFA